MIYVVCMDESVAVELLGVRRWFASRWSNTYHVQTIPRRISRNDIEFLVLVESHEPCKCTEFFQSEWSINGTTDSVPRSTKNVGPGARSPYPTRRVFPRLG
jgi:hypothetical protein